MKNIKFTAFLAIFLLSAFVSTVWAWKGSGTEADPYKITNASDLSQLATEVNELGNDFENTYFEVTKDISYNIADTVDGCNYTAIGRRSDPFNGKFNGKGHTISGIRINKPHGGNQGLFGALGEGAVVENVKLADAEITARDYAGGIVGYNDRGTVSGCTVENSVKISGNGYIGGIAGSNFMGTVSGCISSVTLVSEGENSGYYSGFFGGIVGWGSGTVSDNFAKNVTISVSSSAKYCGAVAGYVVSSNLSNNFYTACTVYGQENTTNVGIGDDQSPYDVTDGNGAVAVGAVTLDDGIAIANPENPVYTDNGQNYYAAGSEITLSSSLLDGKTSSYTANGVRIPSTFPMLAENIKVSVKHDDYWGIEGGADGSEEKPYIISTVDDLNTLASFINAGENYEGKYFNLGADIEFTREKWDAASSSTENNFTPIGTPDNPFKGIFNGKGHTIRGIRIYKPKDCSQGLFGDLYSASVDNVRLADVIITGYGGVGGIAGHNSYGVIRNSTVDSALFKGIRDGVYIFGGIVGVNISGTVSGCMSTATLVSEGENSVAFGGIVGRNRYGTVSGCMSSATLVSEGKNSGNFGGIAGENYGESDDYRGTLNDNAVIGATVPAVNYAGAVVGYGSNDYVSLQNNYYATCTVAGVENATNVGVGGRDENYNPITNDVTDDNGAISVSVTAPTAIENLVYDGSSHNLVTAGETNYGTMYYSLDGKAYSAEIPAVSGANAYTVYYKVMKEEKWTVFDAQTPEVSIAQVPLTVTAKNKSIVYGDDPANDGVEYSGFIGDETASVLGGKLTYSYDYKKLDNVGKYTITPGGLTSGNYKITFVPGTLNVGIADVSVTAPEAKKLVYSGKAQELVTAGETNFGTLLYSLDGKDYSEKIPAASDVNAYTVYYKVASSDNWNGVDAKTVETSIAKADVSVTAPEAKTLVYSGKGQELVSAGSTNFGTLLYSLDGKDYSEKIPAASDVNAYTVYYKVASSDNWNGVDAKTVEVKIAEDKNAPIIVRKDARTGEFKMQRNYDLKGRKVQGKAKAPGAYYGKKALNK